MLGANLVQDLLQVHARLHTMDDDDHDDASVADSLNVPDPSGPPAR